MKKSVPPEPWRDPILGPCACSQLRRTARAVSSLYDEYLASAGLTVTQYALLVTIAREGSIQRTQLAEKLGMERTTLTRNLRPLDREGLIGEKPGIDRREQLVSLTPSGRKRLDKAFACWTSAQQEFLKSFGEERVEQLQELLSTAADASKTVARPRAK